MTKNPRLVRGATSVGVGMLGVGGVIVGMLGFGVNVGMDVLAGYR